VTELTPLQEATKLLGFEVSEQLYDTLSADQQIILDMLLAGCSQDEVADLLGCSQTTISIIWKQIRFTLANNKLLSRRINDVIRHET